MATRITGDLVSAIETGSLDAELAGIAEAIRYRQRYLQDMKAAANKISMTPGTRVRLIRIKPKYMIGLVGTVSSRAPQRRGDIAVDMDEASGRFSRELSVPASCLERI